jgi:hypothetical protein
MESIRNLNNNKFEDQKSYISKHKNIVISQIELCSDESGAAIAT